MKKVLMTAVALTAIGVASPAAAAGADFTVTGSVDAVCSYSGGTIAFGTIGVETDGTITTGQSKDADGQTGFYCNGANTTLALTHSAMTNDNVPSATAPFTRTIDFTPEAKIGSNTPYSGDQSGTSFGAQAGTLVVSAKNLTATGKLLAGHYTGSITLTLTPTV